VLIFANLDRFWIADFAGMEMKRLDELYSGKGQIGFRWYRRMDSRVVDTTAVKYLQMKA
jgi:HK97 family phage major capsid protein